VPAATSGLPPASSPGAGATEVAIVAQGVAFTTDSVDVPGTEGFTIQFDNEDANIPHDVDIRDEGGATQFDGEVIAGPATIAYEVAALDAGAYEFFCSVHPNMVGTLTVTE
jgi:plastocyanin